MGIMEKKMETTIMGCIGSIGYILGLHSFQAPKLMHLQVRCKTSSEIMAAAPRYVTPTIFLISPMPMPL